MNKKQIIAMCMVSIFMIFSGLENVYSLEESNLEISYSKWWGPEVGNYDLRINNLGSVVLINNSSANQRVRGENKINLSSQELSDLKQLVLSADVFGLKDNYSLDENIADGTSQRIEFVINGESKEISLYNTTGPSQLGFILQKVQKIVCQVNSDIDSICSKN